MTGVRRRIIWLDADRFDKKPNKSPWLEMSRVLQDNNFDVTIVTGYSDQPYNNVHARVVSLYVRDIPFLFRFGLLARMLFWILRYVDSDEIVILKPDSLFLAPILKAFGRKNLHLDIRTLPIRAHKSIKHRMDYLIYWTLSIKGFSRYVSTYSFITNRLRVAVEEEFSKQFNDYVIWQSGVNTSLFHPMPDASKLENQDKSFWLFYHGNIYGSRGVDTLVKAMSLLSPIYRLHIRLMIVGPDEGLIKVQDIVNDLGVAENVIIKGHVPYEKIPGLIGRADCCVCPLPDLLEWNVSSPLKVFEYMACGKPIILTPIPAHQDVANGQDYVIWAQGYEAADLRDAIERAFEGRVFFKKAAKAAPVFVKGRYDWERQGQKLAIYLSNKYFGMPSRT